MKDKDTVSPKPDFFEDVKGKYIHSQKAVHARIPIQSVNEREERAYVSGCDYAWREYVRPLQSRIAELEKELCDTKANLGRAYNGIKHRDELIEKYRQYCERNGLQGI